jgi:threonylcarbamoyladenosine tRNA methylthiotransferase MtaB
MGRRIGTSRYEEILAYLRGACPEAALGADIIVGFPGETEDDFRLMFSFLKDTPLTYFHVFSFSPRPGTPAAAWRPVHPEHKKRRAEALRALAEEKNLAFRRGFMDRELEAVVISRAADGSGRVLTGNYIDVTLPCCPEPAKARLRIRITGVNGKRTEGRAVDPALSPGREAFPGGD